MPVQKADFSLKSTLVFVPIRFYLNFLFSVSVFNRFQLLWSRFILWLSVQFVANRIRRLQLWITSLAAKQDQYDYF